MIAPASLIGFALALVACGWMCSAAIGSAVLATRPWLGRRGAYVERAAAAAALTLPVLIAVSVVLVLVGRSLAIPLVGMVDHCPGHGAHPHLCLFHGDGWTADASLVVLIAVVGGLAGTRLVQLVASQVATARALRQVANASTPDPTGDIEIVLAPSPRVFLFVAGPWRPRVYVSTAAWNALADDERRAAIAHERAHAVQGDLRWSVIYGLFALIGAPLIGRRLLAMWASATERICDRRAAEAVGSPEPVARALVALARVCAEPAPSLAAPLSPPGSELALRVESLLGDPPLPVHIPRPPIVAVSLAALIATIAVFADPIHHALETLFGTL